MAERPFDVANLLDMKGDEDAGRVRLDIRRHFGVSAFGTSAYRSIEGGYLVREHDEKGFRIGQSGQEELYVVVTGRATFTVNGERIDAPSGSVVFVRDPAATRSAVAEEPGTTVLALGGKPGEAFFPLPAEVSDANAALSAGDYERAIGIYERLLGAGFPSEAGIVYNIACCEALLGRTDAAIEHLRAAVAADEDAREFARSDADFDSIRKDSRFAELIG
jgi:tetratricopeptide (TPR) repeat protein